MASTTLTVYEGMIIYHGVKTGVLGIGAGNFAEEKFLDQKNVDTRGATAGLWLVIRGKPDTHALRRVHSGQEIEYRQFRIKILAVGSDQHGMYVRFEVSETDVDSNAIEKGR